MEWNWVPLVLNYKVKIGFVYSVIVSWSTNTTSKWRFYTFFNLIQLYTLIIEHWWIFPDGWRRKNRSCSSWRISSQELNLIILTKKNHCQSFFLVSPLNVCSKFLFKSLKNWVLATTSDSFNISNCELC